LGQKTGQPLAKSGKCRFWVQKTPIFVNLDDFNPRWGAGVGEVIRDGPWLRSLKEYIAIPMPFRTDLNSPRRSP